MELFKIGFISIRLIDIVDILIVAYAFYKLYKIMRGTIAFQIFFALILIIGFSFLAKLLNMHAIGWLLSKLTDIWVIAFIILFQPEIRRLLFIIGRTNIVRLFFKIDINQNINEIADACEQFRQKGWGALIVITRTTGLENIIENGIPIQSKINTELLVSIFNPKSPLHDGAVIISHNKIEAAKCLLPLSETVTHQNRSLGTRHRAGLGISENSDAITIIVSEERSVVSIAEDGKLTITKDSKDLRDKLTRSLSNETVAKSVMKVFEKTERSKSSKHSEKK